MKLYNLQIRVRLWMDKCFGANNPAGTVQQRCDRFLEECLELLQACGYDKSRIATLADYTYGRPIGVIKSEVGGVLVTLAALCNNQMVFMDDAASNALVHISRPDVMEKIRDKQARKNAIHDTGPLPGAQPLNTRTSRVVLPTKYVTANGLTLDNFYAAGWTDEMLVEHGYATWTMLKRDDVSGRWAPAVWRRDDAGNVTYEHLADKFMPDWVRDSDTYKNMVGKRHDVGPLQQQLIDYFVDNEPKIIYQCQNSAGLWREVGYSDWLNAFNDERRVVVEVPQS